MQHFCDKRAAKNNQKHYIWQQVNILAIHVTGGVTVWFFKPFLMYPLSLRQLGSDNTAEFYLFTVLLSLIFYGPWLKKVKNCRNYNASGTFTYYFISLKRKLFISRTPLLRTLAITDTKSWKRMNIVIRLATNQYNLRIWTSMLYFNISRYF